MLRARARGVPSLAPGPSTAAAEPEGETEVRGGYVPLGVAPSGAALAEEKHNEEETFDAERGRRRGGSEREGRGGRATGRGGTTGERGRGGARTRPDEPGFDKAVGWAETEHINFFKDLEAGDVSQFHSRT